MLGQILRYQKKLSSPILDRIDIHLYVPTIPVEKLTDQKSSQTAESSKMVIERIVRARDRQIKCFLNTKIKSNSEMSSMNIRDL